MEVILRGVQPDLKKLHPLTEIPLLTKELQSFFYIIKMQIDMEQHIPKPIQMVKEDNQKECNNGILP